MTRFVHAQHAVLPACEALGGLAAEETCSFAYKHPEVAEPAGPLSADDRKAVAIVVELFREHVDTKAFLGARRGRGGGVGLAAEAQRSRGADRREGEGWRVTFSVR